MFAKKKSWWLSNELGSLWMLSLLCSVLALTPPGFSSSLGDITWYSELIMPSISSCLLLGCFDATTFLRRDHKFSIGFRSGLFPGQVISSMLLSWNQFVHLRAVWHGAPSCSKTNSAPSPNITTWWHILQLTVFVKVQLHYFPLWCDFCSHGAGITLCSSFSAFFQLQCLSAPSVYGVLSLKSSATYNTLFSTTFVNPHCLHRSSGLGATPPNVIKLESKVPKGVGCRDGVCPPYWGMVYGWGSKFYRNILAIANPSVVCRQSAYL